MDVADLLRTSEMEGKYSGPVNLLTVRWTGEVKGTGQRTGEVRGQVRPEDR